MSEIAHDTNCVTPTYINLMLRFIFTAWCITGSLAKAEPPPGIVIDYSPAKSRVYIGSPSIAILPNSEYLASHDFFGPGSSKDRTRVFASKDKGKTWEKRADLEGQWWSNLFVHREALYIFGTNKEYGSVVIRKSLDGGKTWTVPKDSKTGLLREDAKFHSAPVAVVVHGGRIWRAMEDAMGPGGWGSHFRAFVMSAPEDGDLLNAQNWVSSEPLASNSDWLNKKFGGWLEGNLVIGPNGKLFNLLRVDHRTANEKAAIMEIAADGKKLLFDPQTGFIDFPGGGKKFTVRWDEKSKCYWSLSNFVPPSHQSENLERVRNTVALIRSRDLLHWEVRTILLYHPDPLKHGFQYLDWLIEGDDLIAVSRTAFDDEAGGAPNQHDANFMTFHRFAGFRSLTMRDALPMYFQKNPVRGESTIRGLHGKSEIVITTTDRVAGAIHSLKWEGKEFIDSHDHGRQLQSAVNLDLAKPFFPEVFNPTEAGSSRDGRGEKSSSRLWHLRTSENRLESMNQMAFWLVPGEKSDGHLAYNEGILSDHLISKRVEIGYRNLSNVIQYDVTFTVPEKEKHTYAQFEAVTGYMPSEFSEFWIFNPQTKRMEPLTDGPGEQALPVILATKGGTHAMGVFSPDQPSKGFESAGYGRFRFSGEKVVKWNSVFRLRDVKGVTPGEYFFRNFVVVGTSKEVEAAMIELEKEFRKKKSP